jgi:hypothetical protein
MAIGVGTDNIVAKATLSLCWMKGGSGALQRPYNQAQGYQVKERDRDIADNHRICEAADRKGRGQLIDNLKQK